MKELEIEKLQELEGNEEFRAAMAKAGTAAELAKVYADFGIELTEEEAEAVFTGAKAYSEGGELSEELLEDVAGGIGRLKVVKTCVNLLAYFAGAAWYELEPLFKKKKK